MMLTPSPPPEPELPAAHFTTAQARRLGVSDSRLRDLVTSRVLRHVFQGVYVRSEVPDTMLSRIAGARLVLKPFMVIRDRTAARIWGVDTFDYRELEILPPIEVSSLPGYNRVRRSGCDGGVRDLIAEDVVIVDGVPVTTPARTAVDLACKDCRGPRGMRNGLAALDGFMREHGLTHDDLQRVLLRFRGRRGVVQAKQLVPLADPRSESPGERWTRAEMTRHGLPLPELQHWVLVNGLPTYRLDLAYPHHRIAIEYDGVEFHEGIDELGRDRAERDRERRTWLRKHGWTVIVVRKDDFTPERIHAWISEIQAALRIAA